MAAIYDQYGREAIVGNRQLTAREIIRMNIARNVVQAYRGREAAENVSKWAKENPLARACLDNAMQLAGEE